MLTGCSRASHDRIMRELKQWKPLLYKKLKSKACLRWDEFHIPVHYHIKLFNQPDLPQLSSEPVAWILRQWNNNQMLLILKRKVLIETRHFMSVITVKRLVLMLVWPQGLLRVWLYSCKHLDHNLSPVVRKVTVKDLRFPQVIFVNLSERVARGSSESSKEQPSRTYGSLHRVLSSSSLHSAAPGQDQDAKPQVLVLF